MSKFINNNGGFAPTQDGSLDLYGNTIGAVNLSSNLPVKVNTNRQLYSTKLDIGDVNNLQTQVDKLQFQSVVNEEVQTITYNPNFNIELSLLQQTVFSTDVKAPKFISSTNPSPNLYLMADGGLSTGSGGGSSVSNLYNFQISTTINNGTGTLDAGIVQFNNATQKNATFLTFNALTIEGTDISVFLNQLAENNEIYIQDITNSDNYLLFNVSGSSINHYYHFAVPVVFKSGAGSGLTNFSNNFAVFMSIYLNLTAVNVRLNGLDNLTQNMQSALSSTRFIGDVSIAGGLVVEYKTGFLLANGNTDTNTYLTTQAADATYLTKVDAANMFANSTSVANYLPLSGGSLTGAITMNANKITSSYTPVNTVDLTNKQYVDGAISTSVASYLPLSGGSLTGAITMNANKITSSYTPLNTVDLTNKQYVDGQAALKLNLSGGTMTGVLNMGSNAITSSFAPVSNTDITNKLYVDTKNNLKLNLSGGTMTGTLNMGANRIFCSYTPTDTYDVVNRDFADANYLTYQVAYDYYVQKAGSTMTGSLTLPTLTTDNKNINVGGMIVAYNDTASIYMGYNAAGGVARHALITGGSNVCLGQNVGFQLTTGSKNVGIGDGNLYNLTTQTQNTSIGDLAGALNVGSQNTYIGAASGGSSGSTNTAIGYNTKCSTYSNCTAIGNGATCTASNQIILGNSSITECSLGNSTAVYKGGGFIKNGASGFLLANGNTDTSTYLSTTTAGTTYVPLSGNSTITGTLTASGFKTANGTNQQLLKADGSIYTNAISQVFTFGANITTTNNYFVLNAPCSQTPLSVSGVGTRLWIQAVGKLTLLAWSSYGTGATMNILRNGTSVFSVVLTSSSNSAALNLVNDGTGYWEIKITSGQTGTAYVWLTHTQDL